MINNKTVLAVIPARGGSKRLPRKNILSLCGKSLIAWSIDAARNSHYIDHIVVTTDDDEIAEEAKRCGALVPFIRANHLSSDTATTEDVIKDCLSQLDDLNVDIIVILQPTSPLRSSEDIDEAITLLMEKDAGGIVSVTACEHPIFWCNTLPINNNMGGFIKHEYAGKRSQDLPVSYRINGAIYVFTALRIMNHGLHLDEQVFASIMPNERSIDIDTKIDFKLAELLLDSRG